MIQFIMITFLPLIISFLLMFINMIISKKSFQDREKSSPFECGFDPISKNHLPFSSHFFMISLIFLIFDIEITLLIPFIFMTKHFNVSPMITSLTFLMILIWGLYIEYSEQSIDWKI